MEKQHIWCQGKTQTHCPLWFEGSGEACREVGSESMTLHPETLTSYLYFEFLAESIMYQMGCDITVSCPDQATHMLVCWGKSPVVSSSKQGENFPWVIWTDDESWIETVYSYVTARLVHFPPRCVNLKKISLPSCFGQVKVFLYQIMTFPVLLKLIERCWTIEESNCWKSKKQPLCGRLWDQGWYNITKVSGLFPCPFLTLIFLSMVDPLPVSWTRPPETLDIFSFS